MGSFPQQNPRQHGSFWRELGDGRDKGTENMLLAAPASIREAQLGKRIGRSSHTAGASEPKHGKGSNPHRR